MSADIYNLEQWIVLNDVVLVPLYGFGLMKLCCWRVDVCRGNRGILNLTFLDDSQRGAIH